MTSNEALVATEIADELEIRIKVMMNGHLELQDISIEGKQSLVRNFDGLHIIDLMDQEPLRLAFGDKVDPRFLGGEFGRSLDPLRFGIY